MDYVSPVVDCTQVAVIEDEGWFIVLLAVLLCLGATIVLGAAVWCMANGHGSFTGGWKVYKYGVSLEIECK